MRRSPGLHAHYDFKYQSGEYVHRYCDIPQLAHEALDMGLDHLLLAGWQKDGFDRGFPVIATIPTWEPSRSLPTASQRLTSWACTYRCT